jgi:hypothetical protein
MVEEKVEKINGLTKPEHHRMGISWPWPSCCENQVDYKCIFEKSCSMEDAFLHWFRFGGFHVKIESVTGCSVELTNGLLLKALAHGKKDSDLMTRLAWRLKIYREAEKCQYKVAYTRCMPTLTTVYQGENMWSFQWIFPEFTEWWGNAKTYSIS